MLTTFESLLPVFLLIALGTGLKRMTLVSEAFWPGLERIAFYILFPALLFHMLATADFSQIRLGALILTFALGSASMILVALAMRLPLTRGFALDDPGYSSVFQTVVRINAFIALAIAEKSFGAEGLVVVAVSAAILTLPNNISSVMAVAWYGTGGGSLSAFLPRLLKNPIILASIAGLLVQFAGIPIYAPVLQAIDIIGRSALGIGLVLVGAGLRLRDAMLPNVPIMAGVIGKLIIGPLFFVAIGLMLGVQGVQLSAVALCGAVPTAMNGYTLAREYGGDAPLYAAITTLQTITSIVTIPLVLMIVETIR